MKIQSSIALLLTCLLFTVFSCSKNGSATNNDTDAQSATDNSFAESASNDAISISAQSEDNGVTGNYTDSTMGFILSPCANVSINIAASLLTVDFGSTNCLCYDGKYRRGKILVSYDGDYRDAGSTHTITFDNYFVNDYKVEGTTTVVNNGRNGTGNLTFGVQVSMTITNPSGKKLVYTSTRTREWLEGESTSGILGWIDDVYSITGSASGTGFDGISFTSNITEALVVALNCRWIESGKIEFTPAGSLTRRLDFGNGGCDSKVNVKIAGFSVDIYLP